MIRRKQSDMTDRSDYDELDWITAVRLELKRYREQHDENTVSLREIYGFSALFNRYTEVDSLILV